MMLNDPTFKLDLLQLMSAYDVQDEEEEVDDGGKGEDRGEGDDGGK